MTDVEQRQYASYTAPLNHGEKLLEPKLASVEPLLGEANRFKQAAGNVPIGDTSLGTLSRSARSHLLQAAARYTSSYRDLPELLSDSGNSIVMSGHQPELFHCGVWYKNFVLANLGKSNRATPIHFIVDNDLCRSTSIQAPHFASSEASNRWIAFDSPGPPIPWENRHLQDSATWRSFPNRVHQECARLAGEPLLNQLWRHVTQLDATAPLGCLLSQARHLIERDLGLQTLELPLSQMVSTDEFAQFSLHLLGQLSRFHAIYNDELAAYRLAHRIRNHAQPLPSLGREEDWLEAPFWCYTAQSATREPLWVHHQRGRMLLSDRKGWEYAIEESTEGATGASVEQWALLQASGMRIRPRALITTMYARLVLCDLFVHGIGGGKYDQITDQIVARFFSINAPAYLVASATMHLQFEDLPLQLRDSNSVDLSRAQQQLNTVIANPETLLQLEDFGLDSEQRAALTIAAEQKQQLLSTMPSKGEKWEWHVAMKKTKQHLVELARPHVDRLQVELVRLQESAKQRAMLNSREYSFCLFPLEEIKNNFLV